MKIVVLGAAGRTGLHVVEQALRAGHSVTAFIHTGGNMPIRHSNMTTAVGDALNPADLSSALTGQEAVISVLGNKKLSDDLITQSTTALIQAMQRNQIRRVVMLSSFVVTPNFKPSGLGALASMFMKGVVSDKSAGEELLKKSGLDWTIVYATRLDKAPAGSPVRVVGADETVSTKNGIARADVAAFMLQQLEVPDAAQKSFLITAK